ncbi:MAG: type II toxin-antitoxin system RelE/ParE family toxin [Deltaproteobacteria bacterium]|nr:type II toxin-antitoxin system RelE/ParE family toxin [Deltaproteobacteria bacterium]
MSYSIRIKRNAARELRRVPKPERLRIMQAVDGLRENPLRGGVLKGDLRGLRRLRVGQYRVVYEVQHTALIVLVVRVAHRRSAHDRR